MQFFETTETKTTFPHQKREIKPIEKPILSTELHKNPKFRYCSTDLIVRLSNEVKFETVPPPFSESEALLRQHLRRRRQNRIVRSSTEALTVRFGVDRRRRQRLSLDKEVLYGLGVDGGEGIEWLGIVAKVAIVVQRAG